MEVAAAFDWRDADPEPARPPAAAWEASPRLKEEEFTRAVALGLFDYLRKSRSHGFVVSLSGGADSSAVSCLVALMVDLACDELGAAEFQHRLQHVPGLADDVTQADRVRRLLHCVYQSSHNSGAVTRHAAETLAAGPRRGNVMPGHLGDGRRAMSAASSRSSAAR